MDFDFTDDQEALRDAVRRWVDRSFGFERRHRIAKAGGATREVYRELADLGLTALAVPEAHGGMGFGPVEAMVVMEELGRGLVNAPLAAGALVAPALLRAAVPPVREAWEPRIADASALLVFAHQERAARYLLTHVTTRAANTAAGWALTGTKCVVPAGDEADAFLVSARVSGADAAREGLAVFVVRRDAPGVTVRGYPTQDGARAAEVTLASAIGELAVPEAAEAIEFAADVGVAAACAEAVGLMDRLTAITAEYLNTRKQFGVPIASFQALRHRMADVKMQLELGRSMSYFASLKLGEPAPARRLALSQAKVQLGQSMRYVGQQCIQLHGGIGVTDEYLASHYFKRLTVLEMTWGDTLHHLGEVSARMQPTAGVFA
jgi:alkylation response protein AidB-like acyl-CoA dehydrogenase